MIAILIAVENPIDSKVYVLTRYYELGKFGIFYRNTVKETFKFVCRESLPGLNRATRYIHSLFYFSTNKKCRLFDKIKDRISLNDRLQLISGKF